MCAKSEKGGFRKPDSRLPQLLGPEPSDWKQGKDGGLAIVRTAVVHESAALNKGPTYKGLTAEAVPLYLLLMPHELSYFLCATPRSGTTLLCDLLAGTGRAGWPQSYYRRQDIEPRARGYGLHPDAFADGVMFDKAYLDAVLREGAGDTGIFGLRIMWGTVAEMAERLRPLRPSLRDAELFEELFGPLIYVHVSRRDKVAQAISLLKAEQSGLWHLAADGSERQRTARPAQPHYDADRIADLVGELERDDVSWIAFFAENRITPVQIEYEALAAAPRLQLQNILLGLRLPPELAQTVEAGTSKMADAESSAWAERFRRERGA